MSTASALSKQVAVDLLTIGAVTLRPKDPFTWTSGIKSPIYCDNRLTMSYPSIRRRIAQGFAEIIKEQFPEVEMIAGTATAGIPHAAWVADILDLPMIYVRDKAKGHGKQNLIEGQLPDGKKVVVIEDLISTGGSSVKAALAVKDAGGETLAVTAIFSYQLAQAAKNFSENNILLHTLSNYEALIDVALGMGKIEQEDIAQLKAWREDPSKFAQG